MQFLLLGTMFYNTKLSAPQKTCKDRSDEIFPDGPNCPRDSVHCQRKGKNVCLAPILRCDLHPNCDNGEDEKNCKEVYKQKKLTLRQGTMTCFAPHYGPNNTITNATVEILAVACDRKHYECWNHEDENGCMDEVLNRFELCKFLFSQAFKLKFALIFSSCFQCCHSCVNFDTEITKGLAELSEEELRDTHKDAEHEECRT